MQQPTTISAALIAATSQLKATSPTARLDAELVLAHILGWQRSQLLAERNVLLEEAAVQQFAEMITRRVNREPIAYLIGQREFYGLNFFVNPHVLIPRPETELLVELALARLSRSQVGSRTQVRPSRLLDLCTGSGCIAVAIAYHAAQVQVTATDISAAALAVAQRNAAQYDLGSRITFEQGDLFAAAQGQYDLIVSNPPYTILSQIDPGVFQYEPHLALDGGADGLDLYRRLIHQAPLYLASGGILLLEIGAEQGAAVGALARVAWPDSRITVHPDLAGHDRVVEIHSV